MDNSNRIDELTEYINNLEVEITGVLNAHEFILRNFILFMNPDLSDEKFKGFLDSLKEKSKNITQTYEPTDDHEHAWNVQTHFLEAIDRIADTISEGAKNAGKADET